MLAEDISRQDLFKACESLFGTDIDVSVEFLRYLRPAGVKAAYRKKAMETHPDRAVIIGGQTDFMTDRFREVTLAYQMLQAFMAAPHKYSLDERGTLYRRRERPPEPSRPVKTKPNIEPLYAGRVPPRRLLFGQYLYYSGNISLSHLIKSIVWQRMRRPSVGVIAVDLGWMENRDVLDVLRRRRFGEKFGESALRLGYLSRHQLSRLLDQQRQIQPQIGKYFIEEKLLTPQEIFKLVVEMKIHNRWVR